MPVIEFEGWKAEVEIEKITIDEYRQMKVKLGLTIRRFMEGLDEMDPDAVTGLYWLARRAAGAQDLALSKDMQFDPFGFLAAWKDAQEDDEAEGEPDPTGGQPASSTPPSNGSSSTTSAPSATTTSSRSPDGVTSPPGRSTG